MTDHGPSQLISPGRHRPVRTAGLQHRDRGNGCVTCSSEKSTGFATFQAHQNADLAEVSWLYNLNRGTFMTPCREEEWTLSVTHTERAIDDYVAAFEELARDLTA